MTTEQGNPNGPRMIKASEFKAKCLKLMDEVAENGEEIVITKNGKPVAKLTAFRKPFESWFGRDRDILKITGDIISPIDVEWEAISNPDRVINP
jgi:prevent-host-death family protein